MQVALITALYVLHPDLASVDGHCSCMLLLPPIWISVGGPDLHNLWLMVHSINWPKLTTCTHGGSHQLQLAAATGVNTALAHVVI